MPRGDETTESGRDGPSARTSNGAVDFDNFEFWRRRMPRPINAEDAREIVQNFTGFFNILAEWSRQESCDRAEANTSRGVDA